MHYVRSDNSIKALGISIFVVECYSESEQEDPEPAVETPPPPYSSEAPLVGIRVTAVGP